MSANDELPGDDEEVPQPDFFLPGVRCGLEMAMVGLIIGLVGLPASSPLGLGIVFLTALVAMTVVLFWCLNAHIAEWIRRAQGRPTLVD